MDAFTGHLRAMPDQGDRPHFFTDSLVGDLKTIIPAL
jgi:hypothetical protein